MYWSAYGVKCSEKQALFLIKTFPFLLGWALALLVSEWDFQWWLRCSLIEILYCFVKVSFIFFAIVCSPELLHTQDLHKFFVSISVVVSMNTACILKMIFEYIHLSRPFCHRCKNFKALCWYKLFTAQLLHLQRLNKSCEIPSFFCCIVNH